MIGLDNIRAGAYQRQIAHCLFAVLAVAIFSNGLYFWLQKCQLVENATYLSYLESVHNYYKSPSNEIPILGLGGMYVVTPSWMFTKVLKDVFMLIFTLYSLFTLHKSDLAISKMAVIPILFGLSLAGALAHSVMNYDLWVGVAGLRPFAYLFAGLLGIWLMKGDFVEGLSKYLVCVLLLELLMGLYEYFYGIPLFSTARLGNRINGTFSFPSALGIFVVIVCTFAATFSDINQKALLVLAILAVYLTGSATALLLLLVIVAMRVNRLAPVAHRPYVRMAFTVLIAATLLALPTVVARYDIYNSLWGRIEPFEDYFVHMPPLSDFLLGKGLGIGSNVVNSVVTQSSGMGQFSGVDLSHARTDSTPLALINQVGLVGMLLFYLSVALAAWRDRRALMIHVAIFLAGLTINILEFFPLNFLWGLLLCRGILIPMPTRAGKPMTACTVQGLVPG